MSISVRYEEASEERECFPEELHLFSKDKLFEVNVSQQQQLQFGDRSFSVCLFLWFASEKPAVRQQRAGVCFGSVGRGVVPFRFPAASAGDVGERRSSPAVPCSGVRPPAAPFMPHVSQPSHCPLTLCPFTGCSHTIIPV